ncbi:MAG TPA: hypothetical protein PKW33_13885 [Anaerolineaceae bacterium]|nr:hypothetical protein [Anaerolineaceae bacterium]HPN52678.1 hypothetical protein [Anaerolineaceae bacterium]
MESCPSDFSIFYHWQEGSLPPPDHYEYDIQAGPEAVVHLSYQPDYSGPGTPTWETSLPLAPGALEAIYAAAHACRAFRKKWRQRNPAWVGGELYGFTLTLNGQRVEIPANLEEKDAGQIQPLIQAVRALIPPAIWQEMQTRREAYQQEKS